MNKKVAVVVVVIIAVLGIVFLTGGFQFSYSTASISDVAMAEEVNDQDQPVEVVSEFTSDTSKIYVTMELSNAPSDTEIKAEWYYVDNNTEIDSYSTTAEGSGPVVFYLTKPNDGWPAGDYRVDIILDGEKVSSKNFVVKEIEPEVTDVALSKNVNDDYRPVDETNVFETDEKVYLSAEVSNPRAGTEVATKWYDSEGNLLYSFEDDPITWEKNKSGVSRIYFQYIPKANWSAGSYSVEVTLNGETVKTMEFEVTQ